ncbi:MAG: sugar transferase [Planctomycetota bacterium]|nr:MAG: sugar transferase [Planctomycetota bacterium]
MKRHSLWTKGQKRLLDLSLCIVVAPLVLPIMVVVASAIWIRMGRPIFFRQERPGFAGDKFPMLKFRTMTQARAGEEDCPERDGERLTSLGKLLRKLSLDELPQIWNIAKGEMSFVGPRPQLDKYFNLYTSEQARRHEVPPGLTGWAQVNGRNEISWEQRLELDVWYVENWSLWLDLKILLMTIPVVLTMRGVSRKGMATMVEFRGSTQQPVTEASADLVLEVPTGRPGKRSTGVPAGHNGRKVAAEHTPQPKPSYVSQSLVGRYFQNRKEAKVYGASAENSRSSSSSNFRRPTPEASH